MRTPNYNLTNVTNKLYERVKYYSLIEDEQDFRCECSIPIGASKKMDEEIIECAFEEVLGVKMHYHPFSWQTNNICEMDYITFEIGLNEIAITGGKSVDFLISEVDVAIRDGIARINAEELYFHCLLTLGDIAMLTLLSEDSFLEWDTRELIETINSGIYCDEEFERMIKKCGYTISEGEHDSLGLQKYIDISNLVDGAKIWLVEGKKQNTMYKEVILRPRVEVLYILHALRFGENIFFDEY